MGWATGDDAKVEVAKLHLAKTRAAVYLLNRTLREIAHSEKGPALSDSATQLEKTLDAIEAQLNR
jgi:hypothetical protein